MITDMSFASTVIPVTDSVGLPDYIFFTSSAKMLTLLCLGDGLVRSGCMLLWAVKDKKVDVEDDEKLTEEGEEKWISSEELAEPGGDIEPSGHCCKHCTTDKARRAVVDSSSSTKSLAALINTWKKFQRNKTAVAVTMSGKPHLKTKPAVEKWGKLQKKPRPKGESTQ
ncbi:anthocyanidin 5,3-O-glucosyltransferase-like [Pyrus ussuriensis x Pyrus communis]|uniref:Anthocyanidin 5,3-O-glucosyltransferase-like n=1 Tax=Pyrus ussuriensis x Pyrus communis TaxID=2448454 RepID=A0A5N5G992_9ROSA|nr:anthocyanidin 5,3-O-glucosyltransferase-like [Pyrus ussuriensis x Pyrus communis]